LKTININLIGEFGKAEKIRMEKISLAPEETIDDKIKFISVAIIMGSCALFAVCAVIWLFSFFSIQQNKSELAKIQEKSNILQIQLDKVSKLAKSLDTQKKELKVKLLVDNQINSYQSDWYKILKDIGNTIPKSIKINKIAKSKSTDSAAEGGIISIKGEINARKGFNPLKIISYFALNVDKISILNSSLVNSKIASIEFNPQKRTYTFTIETHTASDAQSSNDQGQN